MAPTPAPLHSGWCESGHHRRCVHHLQTANGRRPELWCGCDCHDEKAHPLPDQLLATLEQLEHAAGQLWHVDIPDLLDQAALDPIGARFTYDRIAAVLAELHAAAGRLLLEMDLVR